MLYNYIAIGIFAVIAILVPSAVLLLSKLVRVPDEENPVKNSNYESAEASIGESASIATEYMHYFPLFLGFEAMLAIAIIWVVVARSIPVAYSIAVMLLLVLATMFSLIGIAIAHKGD